MPNNRVATRHGKVGHVIRVAPKKGYDRFVPHHYKKERERGD